MLISKNFINEQVIQLKIFQVKHEIMEHIGTVFNYYEYSMQFSDFYLHFNQVCTPSVTL
jgi:hypothetical protein